MVDKDILFGKINQVQQCLMRIRDKTQGNAHSLDDIDIQDIFVLNLQRAVQSIIDMASHIIADEKMGLPDNLKDNFHILQKGGVIDTVLSKKLQKMVGFRNIAVHDYSRIDVEILKNVLNKDLNNLDTFVQKVTHYFKLGK